MLIRSCRAAYFWWFNITDSPHVTTDSFEIPSFYVCVNIASGTGERHNLVGSMAIYTDKRSLTSHLKTIIVCNRNRKIKTGNWVQPVSFHLCQFSCTNVKHLKTRWKFPLWWHLSFSIGIGLGGVLEYKSVCTEEYKNIKVCAQRNIEYRSMHLNIDSLLRRRRYPKMILNAETWWRRDGDRLRWIGWEGSVTEADSRQWQTGGKLICTGKHKNIKIHTRYKTNTR